MHPFIDFVAKNYQRLLGASTLDFCKMLHMLLHKGKTSFTIVLVGNKNLIPDEQGFVSIAKIFDTLINARGFDGRLVVIDTDGANAQRLAATTSDKASIVTDDWMSTLSGLAASLQSPVDLLFFDDGGSSIVANTYSKSTKPITLIDDVLDEGSVLVLAESQAGGKLLADIDTWADDQDKKPFVNGKLIGWTW